MNGYTPSGSVSIVFDERALDQLLRGPNGPVAQWLLRTAREVERRAKMFCPVDTGRLRSSIVSVLATEGRDLIGLIGTDVEYAAFVEFGTRTMSAQSYLRRALASIRQTV